MQITDLFEGILASLNDLIILTQGLVVVVTLHMLISIAIAKNTQHRQELKPRRPSLLSRLRLKKKKELPEGDKKGLVEK